MTKTHLWVRTSRVLLCLVLAFIVVSVSSAFRSGGFSIATDLSDMVPSTTSSATHQLAVDAAQNAAEQSVILMLESFDESALLEAVAVVDEELAQVSGLMQRQNPEDIMDMLVPRLATYRFHLLTQQDRDVLAAGEFEFVFDRALGDLYSPSAGLKLLPLKQDPFNFFSRYVESGIGRAGFAPGNTTPPAADTDESMHRQIITLRLLTPLGELRDDAALNAFFTGLNTILDTRFSQVKILRTGVLFFSNDASTEARQDINLITAGSIIGVSFLMLMVFRSVRPLITATASVLIGVGFAFSVVHLAFGSIHVFTILFGATLIGIVIDYSIHYHYHSITAIAHQGDNTRLYRALLVSLVTSIAGYSALLFSGVAMLQKIAVFSVCGITASWLTVLALGASGASSYKKVRQQEVNSIARFMGKVGSFVIDRLNRRVALAVFAALLATVALLSKGQDDPRRFIHLSEDLLQQSEQIRTIVNDLEAGLFFIVEADDEQTLFTRLSKLYESAGDQSRLVSVYDWLPSPSDQQLNYQVQAPLFDDTGVISEFFDSAGAADEWLTSLQAEYQASTPLTSLRFFELLKEQISPMVLVSRDDSGQVISMAAYVLLGSGADLKSIKTATADIQGVSYIDSIADSTVQLRTQRISSVIILVLAYVTVGILMWLLYRDRRALLMTAVPAVSTVLTLSVLLLMGQPLTLFHTMSLFLILGLGMDYVVFLNEMTEDQKTTRQAIVLSGMTSMLSFGLLALSSVPVAQAFGITILIGNSFNLLVTLGLASSKRWQTQAP